MLKKGNIFIFFFILNKIVHMRHMLCVDDFYIQYFVSGKI